MTITERDVRLSSTNRASAKKVADEIDALETGGSGLSSFATLADLSQSSLDHLTSGSVAYVKGQGFFELQLENTTDPDGSTLVVASNAVATQSVADFYGGAWLQPDDAPPGGSVWMQPDPFETNLCNLNPDIYVTPAGGATVQWQGIDFNEDGLIDIVVYRPSAVGLIDYTYHDFNSNIPPTWITAAMTGVPGWIDKYMLINNKAINVNYPGQDDMILLIGVDAKGRNLIATFSTASMAPKLVKPADAATNLRAVCKGVRKIVAPTSPSFSAGRWSKVPTGTVLPTDPGSYHHPPFYARSVLMHGRTPGTPLNSDANLQWSTIWHEDVQGPSAGHSLNNYEDFIAVFNLSQRISDDDCESFAKALQIQLRRDWAPAWGMRCPKVQFFRSGNDVPLNSWDIIFCDNTTNQGILITDPPISPTARSASYTKITCGCPGIYIFCDQFLNEGVKFLADGSNLTISHFASWQILSRLTNINYAILSQGPDIGPPAAPPNVAQTLYLRCCADPVSANYYTVTTGDSVAVTMCDFVLPGWFNTLAAHGGSIRFNHLASNVTLPFVPATGSFVFALTITGQFYLTTSGGYALVAPGAPVTLPTGEKRAWLGDHFQQVFASLKGVAK